LFGCDALPRYCWVSDLDIAATQSARRNPKRLAMTANVAIVNSFWIVVALALLGSTPLGLLMQEDPSRACALIDRIATKYGFQRDPVVPGKNVPVN
jgi:hypothetical protein